VAYFLGHPVDVESD